jgi:hypothetical protein
MEDIVSLVPFVVLSTLLFFAFKFLVKSVENDQQRVKDEEQKKAQQQAALAAMPPREAAMSLLARGRSELRSLPQDDAELEKQRALLAQLEQTLERWERDEPASFKAHFSSLRPSEFYSYTPTLENSKYNVISLSCSMLILRRIDRLSNLPLADLVSDYCKAFRDFHVCANDTEFDGMARAKIRAWKSADPDAFDEWLSRTPPEALLHDNTTYFVTEASLFWEHLPPKNPDHRRRFNQRLAARLRRLYSGANCIVAEMEDAQNYLETEKKQLAATSEGEPKWIRCGCCGAPLASSGGECDYCGARTSLHEGTAVTHFDIHTLCPLVFLGENQYNRPSGRATEHNLNRFVPEGSFDDKLESLLGLRDWWRKVNGMFSPPSIAMQAILNAGSNAVSRGIRAAARDARGDSDRQRRIVHFAVAWQRDFLKEALPGNQAASSKGANRSAVDAAWETKVRGDLGL